MELPTADNCHLFILLYWVKSKYAIYILHYEITFYPWRMISSLFL